MSNNDEDEIRAVEHALTTGLHLHVAWQPAAAGGALCTIDGEAYLHVVAKLAYALGARATATVDSGTPCVLHGPLRALGEVLGEDPKSALK